MKRTLLVLLPLAALLPNQPAIAGDNNCGKLSILITNTTSQTCQLVRQSINHGFITYTSHVPAFIPANSTAPALVLTQALIGSGPDVDLTYRCGEGKTISIHTKQNYCLVAAGNITSYIINKNGLSADYSASKGSYVWSQNGSVNWAIKD